jgi:hypothetical protein
MNTRQVIVLWIIAIALGAAVFAVKRSQNTAIDTATERKPGETLFAKFPSAEVASITIAGVEKSVTVTKKETGWAVAEREDYPANISTVNGLIRTLDELEVTQSIEAGPSFAPNFGMDEASKEAEKHGITATFKDAAGQEIAKVTFGKNAEGAGGGRYIRNHADESGFYKVSEAFPTLTDEPKSWLAEGFIQVEKIKSIAVTAPDKEEVAWKLTRETEEGDFTLVAALPGQELDAAVTSPLKSLFSFARFEDVIPADQVAAKIQETGKQIATIETLEGFTYTVTFTPAKPTAPAEPAEGEEAAPPAEESVIMTVAVTAELPKERKKEEGETEEDAKTKDTAFAERLKTLTERLEKEKALAGRTFQVSKFAVEALMKERAALIKVPEAPPAAATNPGQTPPIGPATAVTQPVPATPNIPTRPRATATTPPIEAVTPPIAVPPLDEKKEGEAPKEPEAPKDAELPPSEEKPEQ